MILNYLVVINGDGAPWITQCWEYFGYRGYFQLDRFHVAKELRAVFWSSSVESDEKETGLV